MSSPKRITQPPSPPPGRARCDNVIPIEGWVEPLGCPHCEGTAIVHVELVECVRPVVGARKPWDIVVVGTGRGRVDRHAVRSELFRCRECGAEWPVQDGTAFMGPASR